MSILNKRVVRTAVWLICGLAAFSGQAFGQGGVENTLLTAHAQTLAGTNISLPVPGRPTLLVVAFNRKSSEAMEAGWKQAQTLCAANVGVACYQVAMMQDAPSFVRGMVVRGIRSRKSPEAQKSFAIVVEKEAEWKASMHFRDPNAAYAVLLDGKGKILGLASGTTTTIQVEPLFGLLHK